MSTYDKPNRLGEIITELAGLYGELSAELPQSLTGILLKHRTESEKTEKSNTNAYQLRQCCAHILQGYEY